MTNPYQPQDINTDKWSSYDPARRNLDPLNEISKEFQAEERNAERLARSVAAAVNLDPKDYAYAKEISSGMGVDPDLVYYNLPVRKELELDRKRSAINVDHLLRSAPKTAEWLSEPSNAIVAQNDVGYLQHIEDTAKNIWGAVTEIPSGYIEAVKAHPERLLSFAGQAQLSGEAVAPVVGGMMELVPGVRYGYRALGEMPYTFASGVAGLNSIGWKAINSVVTPVAGLFGVENPGEKYYSRNILLGKELNEQRERIAGDQSHFNMVQRAAYGAVKTVGETSTLMAGGASQTVGQLFKSMAVQSMAKTGTIQTGTLYANKIAIAESIGFATPMGMVAGSNTYQDDINKGVPHNAALLHSLISAITETVTEAVGAKTLLKESKNLTENFAKAFAKSQIPEQYGEQISTLITDFAQWSLIDVNKGKSFTDYLSTIPANQLETAITTLLAGGTHVAMGAAVDASQKQPVLDKIDGLKRVMDVMQQASIAETAPNDLKSYLQSATNGESVYIDRDKLESILASNNIDASIFPSAVAQLKSDNIGGAGISIPAAEFLMGAKDSAAKEELMNHLRVSPDDSTIAELNAQVDVENLYYQKAAEDLIQKSSVTQEFRQSASDVMRELREEAQAYGQENQVFSPRLQNTYTQFLSSFYNTIAIEEGVTPTQIREGWTDNNGNVRKGSKIALGKNKTKALLYQKEDNLLALFDNADIINIDATEAVAPQTREQEIDDAERLFISSLPEGATSYKRKRPLLTSVRKHSDQASSDLAGSLATPRTVNQKLGAFAGYRTTAKITRVLGFDQLQVEVYSKEQVEAGLTKEPALLFLVDKKGELSVNGPTPDGATFNEFKKRGWADYSSRDDTLENQVWSSLVDPSSKDGLLPVRQLVPLLADVHARVREWRGHEHTGLRWTRASGSSLAALGRGQSVTASGAYFQKDAVDPKTLAAIDPDTLVISLFDNANVTSYPHELAHAFLQVYTSFVREGTQSQKIKDDLDSLLTWFGVKDFATWDAMSHEERRPHHEKFAETFESYLMTGKAPTQKLQPMFERLAQWMLGWYKGMQNFLKGHPAADPNHAIFAIFDRMIATQSEIDAANAARNYFAMFPDAQSAGVSEKDFTYYTDLSEQQKQNAEIEFRTRSLKDLKYIQSKRAKIVKDMQADFREIRAQKRREVAMEVKKEPIYRLWDFLTAKRTIGEDKYKKQPKDKKQNIDPDTDTMLEVILKLGGISSKQVESEWGTDPADHKLAKVGTRLVVKKDGKSIDEIGQRLAEYGYIPLDEHGKYDIREFEAAFVSSLNGIDQYSGYADYSQINNQKSPEELVDDLLAKPGARLNSNEVKEYGEDLYNRLSARRMTANDGASAAVIAEAYWGGDIQGMLETLASVTSLNDEINARTDAQMIAEYGDLNTDEAIDRAADAAVANEARMRMVATELAMLEKSGYRSQDLIDAMTIQALTEIGNHTSLSLNPDLYRAAEKRANKNAMNAFRAIQTPETSSKSVRARTYTKAIKAGKTEEEANLKADEAAKKAFETASEKVKERDGKPPSQYMAEQKRIELFNNIMYREAVKAKREAGKTYSKLKKIAAYKDSDSAIKSRDNDVVNGVRAILGEVGILTSDSKIGRVSRYLATLQKDNPKMYEVVSWIVDSAVTYEDIPENDPRFGEENVVQFYDLKLNDFASLGESIEDLWWFAKERNVVTINGQKRSLEEVTKELSDKLAQSITEGRDIGVEYAITKAEQRKIWFSTSVKNFVRVESWVGAKDGQDRYGPFRRYIWMTINDGQNKYTKARAETMLKLKDLVQTVQQDMTVRQIPTKPEEGEFNYIFGKGDTLGFSELLHAILHTGNPSNKEKFLIGREWAVKNEDGTLDTTMWDRFVNRLINEGVLTKVHFDFCQSVWNLFEEIKPDAQRAHRVAFGKYFDEVTAEPFTNQFGTYPGGYVPAIPDMNMNKVRQMSLDDRKQAEMLHKKYPTPNRDRTKSRSAVTLPLVLDISSLAKHLDESLLFAHMSVPVKDLEKILNVKEFKALMNKADSSAISNLIMPWLEAASTQVVITGDKESWQNWEAWSNLRSNSGMGFLMGSINNTLQQYASILPAGLKLDDVRGHIIDAMANGTLHRADLVKHIASLSPYMNTRYNNEVYLAAGVMNEILLNPSVYASATAWTQQHAYFLQQLADSHLSSILWIAKYNSIMESKGDNPTEKEVQELERQAIELADSLVRTTQGASRPIDLSQFERSSAFVRLFTHFTGFFNTQANLIGEEATRAKYLPTKSKYARLGMVGLMAVYVPGIVNELVSLLLKGGPKDEDDDGYLDDWLRSLFLKGPAKYAAPMVPMVGPAAMSIVNSFNKNPYDDRVGNVPAFSLMESVVRLTGTTYRVFTDDDYEANKGKLIKDIGSLVSLIGLPGLLAARPAAYITDIREGKVKPTGAIDFARGLATGVASPESKQ